MVSSTKLKIWTIVTHGIIIIGAGHGIGCFFLIELKAIYSFFQSGFGAFFDHEEWATNVAGLLTLIAQACIAISIFGKGMAFQKGSFQIFGLALLWVSVGVFWYATTKDSYSVIVLATALPLFICTVITFCGKTIQRFREDFVDHIP